VAIAEYLGEDDQFDRPITDSPNATPSRASATTARSRTRSDQDGWKRSKAPEGHDLREADAPVSAHLIDRGDPKRSGHIDLVTPEEWPIATIQIRADR
jgi:hypothetical protein